MCFGSKRYNNTEPAKEGTAYCVSETRYAGAAHRHGLLHREETGIIPDPHDQSGGRVACVACIEEERKVTFVNLPPELQQELDIGDTLTATFVPGHAADDDGTEHPDLIRLQDGQEVPFYRFADPAVRVFLLAEAQVEQVQPGAGSVPAQRELVAA